MSSCAKRKLLSRRDANLQLHQVQSRDQFRHRMLDLQARIHFQEIEILFEVRVHQKLDGAGIVIVGSLCATRTATSPMRRRISASTSGEGASSITFW